VQVTKIHMRGVTKHTDTSIDLPETGLVLVTGPNGAGKSSIPEACAVVGWGKTLRPSRSVWNPARGYKDSPRHRNPTCSAAITVGGVEYTRTQRGATGSVTWTGADDYESRREAKGALTEALGSFDAWRRSCVLSSKDAASFTSATSAERMRLVEEMVGVDRFDDAAKAAKDRAKAATAEQDAAAREAAQLRARATSLRSWLATTPPEPLPPVAPEAMPPDVQADPEVEDLRADLAEANEAHAQGLRELSTARQARRAWSEQERQQAGAEARLLAQLTSVRADVCPTCSQAVHDPELEARIAAAHDEAVAAKLASATYVVLAGRAADTAKQAATSASLAVCALKSELAPALDAHQSAQLRRAELRGAHRAHALALARHSDAMSAWEGHLASMAVWEDDLEAVVARAAELDAEAAAAMKRAAVAQHAALVLGPKGPRVPMLAGRLKAIEAATNVWLEQICANRDELLRVELLTAKGTRPEVHLVVHGLEHDEGYAGCSGGECRRIDVAFMLALAQVSEAASGRPAGTLFGDEAFDALDPEGVATCGELLAELAKDRCIVIIAHTAAEGLRPYVDREIQIGPST